MNGGVFVQKKRKLIGVIIAQADAPYQEKLVRGIIKQAYELDYNVAVFSAFIKSGISDEWQVGESNIYNLINFNMLDGIIFAPDTIQIPGVAEKIEKNIKKHFKKPVISVDFEISGFHSIYSVDTDSVKSVINHLIEVHGFTDIAYMTGRKNHPHSNSRLNGYYEALVEHDIQIDTSRVFYGDFWYYEGENVVTELCSSSRPMPQAIACANDQMAISVCRALEKRGIQVPEDIAVVGYDSFDLGQNYYPKITSAALPAYLTGIRSVNLLDSLINNVLYVDYNEKIEPVILESCGCVDSSVPPRRTASENSLYLDFTNNFYSNSFYSKYNFMMESLISVNDLNKFIETLNWYCYQLPEFSELYICLCENWDNLGESENSDNYLKHGYSKKMFIPLYRTKNSQFINSNRFFPLSEMIPGLSYNTSDEPVTYFFTPIHYNDRCFGYAAISFGDKIVSYDETYRMWMRCVNSTLETLRRQCNLSYMYKLMLDNAVTDSLTGAYNRNGYNHMSEEIINKANKYNSKVLLIVGDMNNLKFINDKFGHMEGDYAIKVTAAAIKKSLIFNEPFFRMGGDEFLVMNSSEYSENQIKDIKKRIGKELDNLNATNNKPYTLSISLGVFYGDIKNGNELESAMVLADRDMFMEKEKYKSVYGQFSYK